MSLPRWLEPHGPEYEEFTSHFVSPHVFFTHLKKPLPGAEKFGEHVREPKADVEINDGMATFNNKPMQRQPVLASQAGGAP